MIAKGNRRIRRSPEDRVIDTVVMIICVLVLIVTAYQMGILNQRYSFATAIGMFQSLISVALVLLSNRIMKKLSGEGIF
ncbi:hypothetical protein FACS189462_1440 [Spirochaetia bacterium]|nr:hypothetical protein FACS189462_1440 [Spirochaetia bacterium]